MYQQLKRASMALALGSVCIGAFAQQKTIQGTVKDSNGEPMIGVTITDQNGKAGGITDLDGNFTIQNVEPNTVLTFSYIGCKTQKIKVGGQKSWNITLEDDNAALDEVVVVGYGTMRKRDVTGSIASINSDKIAARGTTNLAESLQGSVPGVNITQSVPCAREVEQTRIVRVAREHRIVLIRQCTPKHIATDVFTPLQFLD